MKSSAADYLPAHISIESLRDAVQRCQGCDLYQHATRAVFGEGETSARLVLVGEQPGDKEDRTGRPFVGPAGRVLDEALETAGIPRDQVYVTNAVKHFKFRMRGKRRLHEKPTQYEMRACRPWLEHELQLIAPEILVLLGATAAQSLLGSSFRITRHRGEVLDTPWARWTFATVHPSSVLRIPDADARQAARDALFLDVQQVAAYFHGAAAAHP